MTKVTDLLVPVMAVIYVLTVIALVVCNFTRIPWFFQAVFGQAFSPDAVFGGAFGTVLSQNSAPGPPIEIAPVTPRIFPGPTRIAVDSKNAASAEIPVFVAALL